MMTSKNPDSRGVKASSKTGESRPKKLSLRKEHLRTLSGSELGRVAGGGSMQGYSAASSC